MSSASCVVTGSGVIKDSAGLNDGKRPLVRPRSRAGAKSQRSAVRHQRSKAVSVSLGERGIPYGERAR